MLHQHTSAVTPPPVNLPLAGLALFATLAVTFEGIHGFADQWGQASSDARNKGRYGDEMVRRDGTPATPQDIADPTVWTMRSTTLGRLSAARHVLAYGTIQTAATLAVTRALGFRPRPTALLAGAAINFGTHLVIDRRRPLMMLAARAGKAGYLSHCTVVRAKDGDADAGGPGTAAFELDQSLHRGIGVLAAAVTAALAVRTR